MINKEYFYHQISKCFDSVIYTAFGSVAVCLFSNDEDTQIFYVAYDIPYNLSFEKMNEEERKNHIKVEKTFDISDVKFNEEMSILQKIHSLVQSFEMEIYSQV